MSGDSSNANGVYRTNEQRVVEHICARWACEYLKPPARYGVAYALHRRSEAIAWLEVGCCDCTLIQISDSGGYRLPMRLWNNVQTLVSFTRRPFFLAVQTLCGGWIARFKDSEFCDIRVKHAEDAVSVPVRRFRSFRDCYQEIRP